MFVNKTSYTGGATRLAAVLAGISTACDHDTLGSYTPSSVFAVFPPSRLEASHSKSLRSLARLDAYQ
jgi:hypothetical protein